MKTMIEFSRRIATVPFFVLETVALLFIYVLDNVVDALQYVIDKIDGV